MGQIEKQDLLDVAGPRFLDYAVSVIKQRALPDVRDGLKPVHRRIVYGMYNMGFNHKSPTKKCAKIVGDVLGSFHPHGDASVYDALVRLGQTFVQNVPLVEVQGNAGSIDDPKSYAAMRYLESRPSLFADEMTKDIKYNCINMIPTFDSAGLEPEVLPAPFPYLLVSSNIGIAVGYKTDTYPYNFNSVIKATIAFIKGKEDSKTIFKKYVQGPDFPTGGKIINGSAMYKYYNEGAAKAVIESTYTIEKNNIIITSIPYLKPKEGIIETIANACKTIGNPKDKNYRPALITEIAEVKDYSNKNGVKIVIRVKKDYKPEVVVNKLMRYTDLRVSVPVAMVCLDEDNTPKVMGFRQVVEKWFKFRMETLFNKYTFIANELMKRIRILKACVSIIDDLENVTKLIKKAEDKADAANKLSKQYNMSITSATYIVEMPIYKFTKKEFHKMEEELEQKRKLYKFYKNKLENENEIKNDIITELEGYIDDKKYPRRTIIEDTYREEDINERELIEKEACTIYISNNGYIKRVSNDAIRNQKKGGKGRKIGVKEGDFINKIVPCNTHDIILFVTTRGKMFSCNVFNIPELDIDKIGVNVSSLVQLTDADEVTSAFAIDNFNNKNKQLLIVTHNGLIKRTPLEEYSRFSRASGLIACKLKDDDYIVTCEVVDASNKNSKVLVLSRAGYCVKFPLEEVPEVGRTTFGSRAIKSTETKEAKVIASFVVYNDNDKIFTVSSQGNGKCTDVSEYRETHRYKVGTMALKLHDKEKLAGAAIIQDNEEAVVISDKKIIKFKTSDIRELKRATFGSRIIKLDKGEKVVGVCRLIELE